MDTGSRWEELKEVVDDGQGPSKRRAATVVAVPLIIIPAFVVR